MTAVPPPDYISSLERYVYHAQDLLDDVLGLDVLEQRADGGEVAAPLHAALALGGDDDEAVGVDLAGGELDELGGGEGEAVQGGEGAHEGAQVRRRGGRHAAGRHGAVQAQEGDDVHLVALHLDVDVRLQAEGREGRYVRLGEERGGAGGAAAGAAGAGVVVVLGVGVGAVGRGGLPEVRQRPVCG